MSIDTARLVNYLAYKVPPSKIADALGVTPARITQVAQDPRIIDLVAAREEELASEQLETVASLQKTNDSLLRKIDDLVESTDSLGEAVRAYDTLTKLQREKTATGSRLEDGDAVNSVVINAPVFIQQTLNVQVNKNNEITGLEGRSMATATTQATMDMINKATAELERELDDDDLCPA